MTENRRSRASAKYDANNTKQIKMKLNIRTDKDILDWLDAQESVQGYIKRLIRDDIQRERMSKLHKRFALIDTPFSEFNYEEDHEYVFQSNDPEEVAARMTGDQTVEEYWADEEDEFAEGSDFWDSEGFKNNFSK